jgi:hypothetical protein
MAMVVQLLLIISRIALMWCFAQHCSSDGQWPGWDGGWWRTTHTTYSPPTPTGHTSTASHAAFLRVRAGAWVILLEIVHIPVSILYYEYHGIVHYTALAYTKWQPSAAPSVSPHLSMQNTHGVANCSVSAVTRRAGRSLTCKPFGLALARCLGIGSPFLLVFQKKMH